MSERRFCKCGRELDNWQRVCPWHPNCGQAPKRPDWEYAGINLNPKNFETYKPEPQEGAPSSHGPISVGVSQPEGGPGGVPSYDSELARIATNLSHSADHHSNHWIEDCRTLLRMVDELTVQFNTERQAYNAIGRERDDLRAKLADADNTIVNLTDEVASYQAKLKDHIEAIEVELHNERVLCDARRQELAEAKAEIARLNAAFESAVSAHNADYARLVEEHKQTLEEFAAYIKECEG